MKNIQVKHVSISFASGDWNLLEFSINENNAALSTFEKSDYEIRTHLSAKVLLESSMCLHKSMRRKRRVQHLFIFFTIALMHFKIYLHQLGTKKQK